MLAAEAVMPGPKKDEERGDLTRRSLGAFKWNALGSLARVGAQFLIGVLLARLLGPEPFGLVAIAWLLLGLGNLVADFGLAAALIQRPTVSDRDIRYAFTLQMLSGLLLAALVAGTAPLISAFFNRPDAEPVLQAMSLVFVLQAGGQTASALLRREMNFRAVQVASVGSYVIGFLLVGVPMAFGGYGVWALVGAVLTQSALYTLALLVQKRHAKRPSLAAENPGMLSFGGGVLAGNLTSWSISNLDAALVGRLIGVTELGLYNRTMNLVATPMNAFTTALQGVLFSAYSRAQQDIAAVRGAYLGSLGVVAVLLVPVFAALAAVPQTAILGVYGEAWLPAAAILTPLALAMPVNALLAMGGPLLLGLGKAGREAGAQAVGAVVLIIAVWLAAGISLAAVAWAVFAVYLLRLLLVTRLALGMCQGKWGAAGKSVVGPVCLGILSAFSANACESLLAHEVPVATLRLLIDLVVAGGVCLLVLLLAGRYLLAAETVAAMLKGSQRLPVALQNTVRRWERSA